MFCAPATHFFHKRNEVAASFGEGIGDLGRDVDGGFSCDNAVFFQLAKLCGENFFRYTGKQVAEFGESLRFKREIPQRQDFPFAGKDVESGFDGTTVMLLHANTPGAYKFVRTSGGRNVFIT